MKKMKLRKYLLFLFVLCNLKCLALSNEMGFTTENNIKYNLSICAVFDNTVENLKEWIDYHRTLGVDHFYLYNTGSREIFLPLLTPYINEDAVTMVNWPSLNDDDTENSLAWSFYAQISAYENAVNFLAREDTRWLLFINTNEYLACSDENIKELLRNYNGSPGISISVDSFDRKRGITFSGNKLIEQATESSGNTTVRHKPFVKMIVQPDQCRGFDFPSYQCRFKNNAAASRMDSKKLKIIQYINGCKSNLMLRRNNNYFLDDEHRSISITKDCAKSYRERIDQQEKVSVYEKVPGFLRKLQKASFDMP